MVQAPLQDKRVQDARRVQATIGTIVPVALALAAVELKLALDTRNAGLAVLCAATALFAVGLVPCLVLVRRGLVGRAVLITCFGILGIQAVYLVVFPRIYATITVASFVIVGLALSFVEGRRLYAVVLTAWAVATAALLHGVLGGDPFGIPRQAEGPIELVAGLAGLTVGMVLLWQFARETNERLRTVRAANEELRKAHGELAGQERAKSRFINAAAHELNTPLTPILLQLHLLQAGPKPVTDPDHKRMIGVMERNVERSKLLVREMLDVARLQAGRLGLRPVDFDLAQALDGAYDDFALVAEAKAVGLVLRPPPPLPVRSDRRRVEQVLSNLVSNAVRLTPAGGTVEVSGTLADGQVTVRVRDTGVGLSEEQKQGLFKPFSRVHDEATAGAGSGLGLYICQGLAREMGGDLWAESDGPGKGATFLFRLPAASSPPPG